MGTLEQCHKANYLAEVASSMLCAGIEVDLLASTLEKLLETLAGAGTAFYHTS